VIDKDKLSAELLAYLDSGVAALRDDKERIDVSMIGLEALCEFAMIGVVSYACSVSRDEEILSALARKKDTLNRRMANALSAAASDLHEDLTISRVYMYAEGRMEEVKDRRGSTK